MAGPWEQYAAQKKAAGPWEQFKKEPEKSDPTQGFRTTLQFGPFDTGIELPESVSVGLAGAGKRLSDIGTLGMAENDTDAALMQRPAAQVGSAVADVASAAFPLARAGQAVAAVPRVAKMGALPSQLVGQGAVAGVYEAATRPGDIGDRALSGATGAGFAVGGDLALRGVGRLAGGPLAASRTTPEAKNLIDQGVPVPPWKASDSPRLRDFGERAKASFLGKQFLTAPERKAFVEWNRNLVSNATPPKPVLSESGQVLRWEKDPIKEVSGESLNLLRNRFDDAYGALYKGRAIPVDDAFRGELTSTMQGVERYYPHLTAEVKGVVNKVEDLLSSTKSKTSKSPLVTSRGDEITKTELGHVGVTPGAVKEAIDTVGNAITSAYRQGNGEKAEALEGIANALADLRMRGLPPEVQSMAKDINRSYTNFLQLQKAHSMMGAQTEGLVTPRQVMSAMKSLDRSPGKAAFARGNVPNQRAVVDAERVLGSRLPEVGPGTAEKLIMAGLLSSPFALMGDISTAIGAAALATPGGQRYAFGMLPYQGVLGQGLRSAAPYAGQATRGILAD